MRKRLLNLVLLILTIVFTIDLIRSYFHLQKSRQAMRDQQQKLDDLTVQNENLQRKLAGTNTADFLEKQVREKLNMGKSGELVIILPTIIPTTFPTLTPVLSNWEKWVEVYK
jgi:cell division protein FtsB